MLALIPLVLFLGERASRLPEYQWQWPLLWEFIARKNQAGNWECGLLAKGFFTTLRVGFWTILLSLAVGGAIGAISAQKSRLAAFPCHVYVNLFRNTPPLVIIFALYFFAGNLLPFNIIEDAARQLSPFGKQMLALFFAPPGQLDRMFAAVLALGLYQGAYVAEITRGGIESVPRGQWDAAAALGFSRLQRLRFVILPQAARLMLPPLTGQAISSFKESALASLISVPDLTFQSLEIMAISRMTFEIWVSTGILYLLLGILCAILGRRLEKRFSLR